MSHGPTTFSAKNYCIYCRKTNTRLTDEHVLPFSLGGTHVLAKASCDVCADVTKRFEQDVARELWGDARASYGAPTRRKKQRSTHKTLVDSSGRKSGLVVPMDQYPAAFVFYTMHKAGFLTGEGPTKDSSGTWQFVAMSDDARRDEFVKKYPDRLTIQFRHVPHSFARLLAKIAYCQVLTALDAADFTPHCLDLIFGKEVSLSYLVGSRDVIPPPSSFGYQLTSVQFGNSVRRIIGAEIRMFANCHTPVYHVVVGEINGKEQIQNLAKKLDEISFLSIHDDYCGELVLGDDFHWAPTYWPMK
jgi:hypothetical protein